MSERLQLTIPQKVYDLLKQEASTLGMTVADYAKLLMANQAQKIKEQQPVKA